MNKVEDKKIIVFVLPSLVSGGMERVVTELANHWCKNKNLIVHIIMYCKRSDLFYETEPEVILHYSITDKRAFNKVFFLFTRLYYLRKKVALINPDTVVSFGTFWNKFVLFSLMGTKFPVFVSDRGQPGKKLGMLHSLMIKILYPGAAGIIAQTNKAEELYKIKKLNRNIQVIGNPILKIKPNQSEKRENIVLSVGRLIKSKHHDRLIRIFAAIEAPGWKLVIVGGDIPGQNRIKYLQRLAEEEGVVERVILVGEQKNVETYYQKSKLFAFTSSSEGFPNVIGEALSAGLPVISYDCVAGPAEMIQDGHNGFLVSVFDDRAFKEKLELLLNNENLRNILSENAQNIKDKFSIQKISDQYLKTILIKNYV